MIPDYSGVAKVFSKNSDKISPSNARENSEFSRYPIFYNLDGMPDSDG